MSDVMSIKYRLCLLGLLFVLAGVQPAGAQVELVWSPADTTLAPGTPLRLSLLLSDTLDIRTVEFTAAYDTAMVQSLTGDPGDLFTAGGFNLFTDFLEDEPGLVHGYAVIMGHDDFLTGPGELFTWDVSGRAEGPTVISILDIKLYTPDAILIPDVILGGVALTFKVPSGVPADLPPATGILRLAPNPFNPRTVVSFELEVESSARLSVFDARGRLVDIPYDRYSPAGRLAVAWDGRDRQGNPLPGGTYLFQLKTISGVARTKGLLLK